MNQFLADIALPVPIDKTFTYIVPPELQPSAVPGKRVLVPFGAKHLTGIIIGTPAVTEIRGLKPVTDILDTEPIFSSEMLLLARWIGKYYFTPLGEVLKAAAPQGLSQKSKKTFSLIAQDVENLLRSTRKSAPQQHAVLKVLAGGKPLTLSQIQHKSRTKSIHSVLNEMHKHGWISVTEEIEEEKARPKKMRFVAFTANGEKTDDDERCPASLPVKQLQLIEALRNELSAGRKETEINSFLKNSHCSLSSLKSLVKKEILCIKTKEVMRRSEYDTDEKPTNITLNADQQHALDEINNAISEKAFKAFLLHGITGSGKTQVYIEAIRSVIARNKTAIVLVPEISLTPQTVRRFKAHFGNDVAVMHSQMSVGERYDAWRIAHQGKAKIMIGPRSAIFAPLENIGLIVVDEEHESSYKQYDAAPRYNARDVALVRASQIKAVVVLGSATPSVESYANTMTNKYTLLELPRRIDTARLPAIKIVDMAKNRQKVYEDLKKEIKTEPKPFPKQLPASSLSNLLKMQITDRLERREGIILLQNRRGFSHVMECYDCGYVEKCINCEVSLTFHAVKKHLRCHYCGFVKKPPAVCPECGSFELRLHAFGTQQVQEELQGLFPNAVILRMDRDTTSSKGAHNRILNQFESGKADILLGTQMVAKGLDFPHVTLVGVISADTQMLLPDFRASENTFQLLTQVAGRAGRSSLAGEVVIQTLQPEHYCLKHVVLHDFRGFYDEELKYRSELGYPPFSRIVLIEFSGRQENEVQLRAKKFSELLNSYNRQKKLIILGPADAAIPKIKNVYRKHIVIKDLKKSDPSGSFLRAALLNAKSSYESLSPGINNKVKMTINVDPQGMM
ncbi:MAG: primosomal protein N' [Bacteroidetes bacterium]|nr:primosomal protein N' [Bacteroidota bacterium]